MSIEIKAFSLRQLFLDSVGPIRGELYNLKFEAWQSRGLANMFMMAAENGRGKTTVLESIAFLVGLLDPGFPACQFADLPWRPDDVSRMQLDIETKLVERGVLRQVLLRLTWGDVGPTGLDPRTGLQGSEDTSGSESEPEDMAQLGFCIRGSRLLPFAIDDRYRQYNDLLMRLQAEIELSSSRLSYMGFGKSLTTLPTLLYFCANRDIVPSKGRSLSPPERPYYQVLQRFGLDGIAWSTSLEHLLVWLYWLDERMFTDAALRINDFVFRDFEGTKRIRTDGLNKDALEVEVVNGDSTHPLGLLSSGEKSLVTMVTRAHAHRTRNTIILVDELEMHLHPRYITRLVALLKSLVAHDAATVIFTTHSREVIREFQFDDDEDGLLKNAVLILDE